MLPLLKKLGGDPHKRDIRRYSEIAETINGLEPQFAALSDEALRDKTREFRERLAARLNGLTDPAERKKVEQAVLDELLPEAFAAAREASKRAIGLRHYDVQLIGAMTLHGGRIAEMRTGEGKTLVATLPLYLNALTGRGAHLVTVNDYLARRDARWMGPIYAALGLSVGVLQEAARTEGGRKALIYDPEKEAAREEEQHLRLVDRAEAYGADITYGTNHEFGFDYLRDNMALRLEDRVQRGRYYAIVDEVDNILIDEARTPLIISGPAPDDPALYYQMAAAVRQLVREDYEIDERGRSIALTEQGYDHIEKILGQPLRDPDNPEAVSPEQAKLIGNLEQALRAEFLFKKNKDYLVEAGHVVIVDEFTGRKMHGRRWSDGLHQAVEAKEGLRVQQDNITYATITLQNYFRLYDKLAGMSGTALTESEEFDKIYKLGVLPIPTNIEYQATGPTAELVEVKQREDGVEYGAFARKTDPGRLLYYRRKDFPDVVFRTEEAKLRAICEEILARHCVGQPILAGTTSVELSERVSGRLRPEPLRKLGLIILLREAYFEAHPGSDDGRLIEPLQPLYKDIQSLSPADFRPLAKELDLNPNPQAPENILRLAQVLDLTGGDTADQSLITNPQSPVGRLAQALQSGIPHSVLNAKKHDEESQIIAGAGQLGAVTIATNMAGRGVDIKLGGELADEVVTAVSRVLRRNGHANPYDMTMAEQLAALEKMQPSDYGIYEAEVAFFRQQIADMKQVQVLGGLHVVGSERHEARRIDNQLRGRAARQGDPGSSRFYLSLEDDLMRRFGGSNVSGLMERLKIDDSMPIAANIVSRIIEQSQSRVEGYNFDIRKHLLEYDDVLNEQRNKIYQQRDRIFAKDDLADDLDEMLVAEINRRVDLAYADDDGPWRLFEWTEQVQPPIADGDSIYPSYTVETLVRELGQPGSMSEAKSALVRLAGEALEAERKHILQVAETLVERSEERAKETVKDRRERVEMAFEGVELEAETSGKPIEARALARAATDALGLEPRSAASLVPSGNGSEVDLHKLKTSLLSLAESTAAANAAGQALAGLQRRTGLALKISVPAGGKVDWADLSDQILTGLETAHASRAERHVAEIEREIGEHLSKSEPGNGHGESGPGHNALVRTLIEIAWGRQNVIDKRTHRTITVRTQRFPLFFLAAEKLADRRGARGDTGAAGAKQDLLEQFHGALEVQRRAWGEAEMRRVSTQTVQALDARIQGNLRQALGDEGYAAMAETSLLSLDDETRAIVRDEIGRQLTNTLHRQLMLQISGQLWIDYLTAVEGLRTSVGLEAYAQRDPLLQYKSRAFDLFQELIVNMRAGVVSRLFTYRPRELASVQPETRRPAEAARQAAPATAAASRTVGRNDPCWCGSGKKFKNCHGRGAGSDEAAPEPAPAAATAEPAAATTAAPQASSKSAKRRKNRK
jgi:preprotein translocase subunit SecA